MNEEINRNKEGDRIMIMTEIENVLGNFNLKEWNKEAARKYQNHPSMYIEEITKIIDGYREACESYIKLRSLIENKEQVGGDNLTFNPIWWLDSKNKQD